MHTPDIMFNFAQDDRAHRILLLLFVPVSFIVSAPATTDYKMETNDIINRPAGISVREVESSRGIIRLVTLTNACGASVTLSALGAGIVDVSVPDREGNIENVALAYADPADYICDGPCMGKTPGRYANRIARGHLVVDGKEYKLAVNCGPHHLHGGPEGFQNRIWNTELLGEDGVCFSLRSVDGDEAYPGTLETRVTYRWSDDNALTIDFEAKTDAPTVVNLTNHTYWNLAGADKGNALNHLLRLRASRWLPTDDTLIPLPDAPASVAGTPMDFTEARTVGSRISEDFPALRYGKGYDNCWVFDTPADRSSWIEDAVMLRDEASGRTLYVDTDQPGVQVYSGNWLSGSPLNRSGRSYNDYDGIAIEAQGFPDAPNRPDFPSQLLRPGEIYRRRIRYRFVAG